MLSPLRTALPLRMRLAVSPSGLPRLRGLPSRGLCAPPALRSSSLSVSAAPSSASLASIPHSLLHPAADPLLSFYSLPCLSPAVQRLLTGYAQPAPIHVMWADQDMFGHVNNARYITWIEVARTHWLRQLATVQLPPADQDQHDEGERPAQGDGAGVADGSVTVPVSISVPDSISSLPSAVASFMCGHGAAGPILKSNLVEYKLPVQFPDLLVAASRVGHVGADRFALFHRLVSVKTERVVAEAEGIIVCFNYDKQAKTEIPSLIRRAIEQRVEQQQRSDQQQGMPVKPPRKSINFQTY